MQQRSLVAHQALLCRQHPRALSLKFRPALQVHQATTGQGAPAKTAAAAQPQPDVANVMPMTSAATMKSCLSLCLDPDGSRVVPGTWSQ